jgi:protein-L-isoaspartate(D-aspartate) O-methyltransferase
MVGSIEQARHWYAEELRFTAKVGSRAVIDAFATVPRELFFEPGPWRILSPMAASDFWARVYDQLELTRGLHIVHIGAGSGYYSAILAEIAGSGGHVVAIEIDPELATRARLNLAAAWPQATVIVGNGFAFRPDRPADVIVVNAGVNNISMAWLDALAAENGRVFVPLTTANWWGGSLIIERRAGNTRRYSARYVGQIGVIHCVGGRESAAESRLCVALAHARLTAVRSLRRAPDEPDETCWLAGDGWWLSTASA